MGWEGEEREVEGAGVAFLDLGGGRVFFFFFFAGEEADEEEA